MQNGRRMGGKRCTFSDIALFLIAVVGLVLVVLDDYVKVKDPKGVGVEQDDIVVFSCSYSR